ncbi:exopolysaccharide transport family protein [Rhodohalobacter sp.]|uniref:GumC family protein n=1 Tax=Rhodohalobacter sp. TaxID=1974210 RepID=UPI002ACEC8EE|nr:exopolysaccharide transport family protein [Rhodohalobacter sp.]MDZ7755161.1 exopolysaccharide transport family protein [Rhodohalobacter sp.]
MSDIIHSDNEGRGPNQRSKFEFVPVNPMANQDQGGQGGLDPKYLVSLILKYKWLILLFVILGGTGAWFYSDTLTPIYKSSGTMIISAGSSGDDELSRIISQTTGVGTSSTIANEIQVLKSRDFAQKIAGSLIEEEPGDHRAFPVLWNVDEEGNISRASEAQVTGRIRRNLSVNRLERDSEIIDISFESPSPEETSHVSNMAMEIYVESSTQENRRAAELTAEFLEREKRDIEQKLQQSEKRLQEFMDNTGIVQMDEQASGIVTRQTSIEMELQQVKLELESVNQAIQNHEQRMESLKPGLTEQFSEAIGPRIRNSQEQLARYEGERTLILTRNPNVRDREQTPPRLKFLDEEIERVKNEIRDLSAQLFTEDEEYTGMDSEERAQMIATIQTRLTELRIQQNQLQSRSEALEQRKQEIEQDLNSLPEGMMQLARLQRDVAMNEELYLTVSQNYAEMSVLRQSQFGFGRIVDTALTPRIPISPNKKIILLVGIMLGGVLSAGIIFVREFMDNSVNNLDMLRTSYLPLLAAVPVFDKVSKKDRKSFTTGEGDVPKELVLLQDRSNLASEAIRRVKYNLIYQNGDTPPKTIAVTSAEKGDGKSTIVSNLAVSFADDGYKTLLIDTDFRRPKAAHLFWI